MYENEMLRYTVDSMYNQEFSYDYGMPPEANYPCPSLPPPQYPPAVPPTLPPEPNYPMPPIYPMPPTDPWSELKVHCLTQLKAMLEKMKNKKVELVIEGMRNSFDCARIIKVDECMVMVEAKSGVCTIPLGGITAVCMSKEAAEKVMDGKF